MPLLLETPHPDVTELVTGHFRETPGYRAWRERGTTDWLLILTLNGRGRFGHGGSGETIAEAGDAILIRPGTRHDYGVEPTSMVWDILWAHFQPRPTWHEWLHWPEVASGLMRLPLDEPLVRRKIVDRFHEAHKLATGSLRRRNAFAMNALEEALLWCDTQNTRVQSFRWDPRVQAAVDYACSHLADKITTETLAAQGDISASRLTQLFRVQIGLTPQQFLEQQRLARAQQLLAHTARLVGAIATEVGFENPFYFTLRFKKHTGLSPRDWRTRALKGMDRDADS